MTPPTLIASVLVRTAKVDAVNQNTKWIEIFFDVSQPYPYILIISFILFALGFRRTAVLSFFGAVAVIGILSLA